MSVAIRSGVIKALNEPCAARPKKNTHRDELTAQVTDAIAYKATATLIVRSRPHFSPRVPDTKRRPAKGKKNAPIPQAIVAVVVSNDARSSGIIGDITVPPNGPKIPHM